MDNLKRLLAATDLSAPARHAAMRAGFISRETGASLDLVHVAETSALERLRHLVVEMPAAVERRMLDAAREEMETLAATLTRLYDVAAGVRVASGSPLAEIAATAEAGDADMLVLGFRGAGFMRHLLLGSTAERMIRKSRRPTLVVKQAAHEAYRNVLVPVDFSCHSLKAIRHARALAPGAGIILMHAFEVPFEGKLRYAGVDESMIHRYLAASREEALNKLQVLRAEAGHAAHDARLMVVHGDPSQQIVEQEQEQDCDLIVVGKHGESMVEELLLGSVTKHVLTESQCDVLVSH
jgi:nucleotide-binding universal stress UspA family protein